MTADEQSRRHPDLAGAASSRGGRPRLCGLFARRTGRHGPFEGFHVAAKLSEAVDAVRRDEVASRPELKRTRWLWLKDHSNLNLVSLSSLADLRRLRQIAENSSDLEGGGRTNPPPTEAAVGPPPLHAETWANQCIPR